MILRITVVLLLCWFAAAVQFEFVTPERIEEGKKKYEHYNQQSSPCWREALGNLKEGCKTMQYDEQKKARFVLALANCLLESVGRNIDPCGEEEDTEDCLKLLDDTSLLVYTEFFTHSDNICFYLQSAHFQEQTERTINKMQATSVEAVERMESLAESQSQILEKQAETGKRISEVHDQAVVAAEALGGVTSTLDRLMSLQSSLFGEFLDVQAVIYYVASVVLGYLLTTAASTHRARTGVYLLLTCSFLAERTAARTFEGPEEIMAWIWFIRKGTAVCALGGVMITALTHKDLTKMSYHMLQDQSRALDAMTAHLQKASEAIQHLHARAQSFSPVNPGAGSHGYNCSDAKKAAWMSIFGSRTRVQESWGDMDDSDDEYLPSPSTSHSERDSYCCSEDDHSDSNGDSSGDDTADAEIDIQRDSESSSGFWKAGYWLRTRKSVVSPNSILAFESPAEFAKGVKLSLINTLLRRQEESHGDNSGDLGVFPAISAFYSGSVGFSPGGSGRVGTDGDRSASSTPLSPASPSQAQQLLARAHTHGPKPKAAHTQPFASPYATRSRTGALPATPSLDKNTFALDARRRRSLHF